MRPLQPTGPPAAQVGDAGQRRLGAASALVVGCGALGTHTADALARAGVGHMLLVDRDIVEWSNLQRQSLFTEADAAAGLPKAVAARQRLREAQRPGRSHRARRRLQRRVRERLRATAGRRARRHGQLPDPLPAQRLVPPAGHPVDLRGRRRHRGRSDGRRRRTARACAACGPTRRRADVRQLRDRRHPRAGDRRGDGVPESRRRSSCCSAARGRRAACSPATSGAAATRCCRCSRTAALTVWYARTAEYPALTEPPAATARCAVAMRCRSTHRAHARGRPRPRSPGQAGRRASSEL